MNYIVEINAFHDWLETNPMSEHARLLWFMLMHINNKAGWQREFTVAISALEFKSGMSKKTIERARNELAQKGRITWNSRSGNQSAVYRLVSLIDAQCVSQTVPQVVSQVVVQTGPINKLNKTKQYNKPAARPSFSNFKGRQYDADRLEEILIARSRNELNN
ncbi:MAG: DnaD domain protein [Clostridia bacterium]|jgi:hypothetical protein|nr:DnaD domain protein [Clostridia bacterium]